MTGGKKICAAILGVCAAAGLAQAVQTSVSQKGKTFTPDDLALAVGETVRIENDDAIPHNVQFTAPDGQKQNLGLQMPGERADVVLAKAGDYMIYCGIHPKMKLTAHAR